MRKAFLLSEEEKEQAKAKLLRSEVARGRAEAKWKTLVKERDKWRSVKAQVRDLRLTSGTYVPITS